ncbi:SPOR domain-containing protein [Psychromonas sp. MME2]|uniref:SPOR domain-containing protein n=1 Tax=unclassified Psychromonas TaxID=2614957 RepID=UPI00339BD024
MASQFKNRLVGVTIVVASVVIFLPSIIDGKKATYQDEFVATPIKPLIKEHTQVAVADSSPDSDHDLIDSVEHKKNEPIDVIDNTDWEIQEVAPTVTIKNDETGEEANKSELNAIETAKSIKKTLPDKAWTIQLGAFQNAENINQLLKKLHKAGFQAHTVPSEVVDGQLTRVFVGPDVSKEKLEKQLPQLKRLTNLKGQLIPFNAVNP